MGLVIVCIVGFLFVFGIFSLLIDSWIEYKNPKHPIIYKPEKDKDNTTSDLDLIINFDDDDESYTVL